MIQIYAVFTGDIIGSTKAPAQRLEETMRCIEDVANSLQERSGLTSKFTRFRGDGWQFVCKPGDFLRAATLILAKLRANPQALKTRIAIGCGTVQSLGTKDLNDASGFAFVVSGQALDSLKRDRSVILATHPNDAIQLLGQPKTKATILGAIQWQDSTTLDLITFIAGKWTVQQAEAVAMAIEHENETQAEIAARLNITRQALNLRLTGAGYRPVSAAVKLASVFADIEQSSIEKDAS